MLKKAVLVLALVFAPLAADATDVTQNIMARDVDAIPKMTVKKLKSKLDKRERVIIVDVRTGGSWDHSKVKVKGAIRIPYQDIAKRAGEIPFGSEVVTYCT